MEKQNSFNKDGLRPQLLADYVGQIRIRNNLSIYVEAAKRRKESLDHVLFYGPPGLGKTTMAVIIANEMRSFVHYTSAANIEKPSDLATLLASIATNDVLFIDEFHRLNRVVEEILYPVMEDFHLSIIVSGNDGTSRSLNIQIPHFTLVGATTKIGGISAPLRSRFGIVEKLSYYSESELGEIVRRTASIMNVKIENDASTEIAKRSRGTPRVANRLFKRVYDFALFGKEECITKNLVERAMESIQIDCSGLEEADREYLRTLKYRFNERAVGVEAISSVMNEDITTIVEIIEPFLIQKNLINRTAKGRELTKLGLDYV